MRPATIVFVNLQFQGRESDAELCSAMQLAALGIARLVTRRHGRVNKVFMFDKVRGPAPRGHQRGELSLTQHLNAFLRNNVQILSVESTAGDQGSEARISDSV